MAIEGNLIHVENNTGKLNRYIHVHKYVCTKLYQHIRHKYVQGLGMGKYHIRP